VQAGLFSTEGFVYLMRWFHYFFGVMWIGLLYYFNFVQGSFLAETDASTKAQVTQKLLPRALWWFRYGALGTFLTGLMIIMIRGHQMGWGMFHTPWGITILTGALLGTLMFLNVWLIIWPNQKIVIANAVAVAAGKPADPAAAAAAPKAALASRTNTLFSIPMLFFMGAASHLPVTLGDGSRWVYWGPVLLVIGLIELNAIKGKMGPLATVKGVVHMGFVLSALLYAMLVVLA
jgi:uncharacterized membrane protein